MERPGAPRRYHTPVRRTACKDVTPATRMVRGASALLATVAIAACTERPPATTLDDALRAYDSGRYADALRAGTSVRQGSTDPGVRAQAAYVEGCAALELGRRDEARDAFAVAARSADPAVAGRSTVMQAGMAVTDQRWSEAERLYAAAAGLLRGRDAELAREQAKDAGARAAALAAPPAGAAAGASAAISAADSDRPATAAGAPAPADGPDPAPAPASDQDPEDTGPDDSRPALLPPADEDAPWTVSAGVFSTETAARMRATNIAKMAKAAGLPTPKVLAVTSPGKRVWVVEVGSFADRSKADAARRKITTSDAQVVRSRVPDQRR